MFFFEGYGDDLNVKDKGKGVTELKQKEEEDDIVKNPTFKEVTEAIEILKLYLMFWNMDSIINNIERQVMRNYIATLKNAKIDSYFCCGCLL